MERSGAQGQSGDEPASGRQADPRRRDRPADPRTQPGLLGLLGPSFGHSSPHFTGCVSEPPLGDVFRALADPTRRAILDELSERSGQTLFELCSRLAARHGLASTRQAISQHLAVLEDSGLVVARREGRYRFHDLRTEPLEHLADRWLEPRRRDDP